MQEAYYNMSINNLHSLLTGQWFIDKAYSQSLLPSLYAVLSNKTISVTTKDVPETFIASQNSPLLATSSFDGEANNNDYVLMVSLKNPIYKYSQSCGPQGTKYKQKIMQRYESDPNCKGVVLDIDSGGGQVAGTPEFHDFIKNYSKPVVTYTDGMMCSAAYYIGAAANHIVANKRVDAIGSIGTMIYFVDMTGFYEKKGAKVISEYATKSTDKNKNFEELLNGNAETYIKNVLDPITETFHSDMKSARTNLSEKVLTGATYNAEDSLSLGLIDEIGTLQTAIDKVFELSKAATNNSNSKQTNMARLNVPNLEAIIGESFSDAENETGVLLTDEQALAVEQQLQENATALENATETATSLATAPDTATSLTTVIQNALTEAGVENATELSNEEGVVQLSALIAEYGANDGGTTTTPIASTDEPIEENKNIVSGVDITAALNN